MNVEKVAAAVGETVKRQMESARKALAHLAGSIVEMDSRIKQLEERQPERGADGTDGKDGASVTVADVAPLIAEQVQKAVAAIAVPKDGSPGRDGKDAEPIDVADVARELAGMEEIRTVLDLLTAEAVVKHFEAHPVRDGKDGEDGKPGQDGKDGIGIPGKKGDPGKDGAGVADLIIDRDGALVATFTDGRVKALGPVVGKDGDAGKDGRDGVAPFDIEWDGERAFTVRSGDVVVKTYRLALPLDKGYWRDGMICEKGDVVTHDGTAFIALRDTNAKPCREKAEDWRILARKGRDGNHGRNGIDATKPVKVNADG